MPRGTTRHKRGKDGASVPPCARRPWATCIHNHGIAGVAIFKACSLMPPCNGYPTVECATQRPTVLRGRDWALHWAGTVAAG